MNKFSKFFVLAFIAVAIFSCTSVSAMTEAERQALIAQIQQQIILLTQQLQQMLGQQSVSDWCYTFNTNLGYAQFGSPDVVSLHTVLDKEGISYSPDGAAIYADGTDRGVRALQAKYGIVQTGFVGPQTRAKLNSIYGCSGNDQCSTAWTCGSWSACSSGYQTRTCVDGNNCKTNNGKPSILQACTNSCSPNWQCGTWSTCSNGLQTRSCSDANSCGITTAMPATSQTCTGICTPQWTCENWSACSNGSQTRTCTDGNGCGNTTGKPSTQQSCTNSCSPDWQCGNWSLCSSGQQTRSCTDTRSCGITAGMPTTSQTCSVTCTPQWGCTAWSACSNGSQTRTCTDSNNCGITDGKPNVSQSCSGICTPNWTCGAWTTCANAEQSRTCTDSNNCGILSGKPDTTQSCVVANCTPSWKCYAWSQCSIWSQTNQNPQKSRTCYDTKNCGTNAGMPVTEASCAEECLKPQEWSCSGWGDCKNGQKQRGCSDLNTCLYRQSYKTETTACNQVVPTVDLKANGNDGPVSVAPGSSVILTWTVTEADSCVGADDWSGGKAYYYNQPESSPPVTGTKKFTLRCTNPLGTTSDSVIVNSTTNLQVDIKAAQDGDPNSQPSDGPVSITNSSKVKLTWSSFNATSCSATGDWTGFKTTIGEETTPTITSSGSALSKTYTITCLAADGRTASDSVTVNIGTYPYPIVADLKIFGSDGPIAIPSTQKTILLSWSASGAQKCFLRYNNGSSGWTNIGDASTGEVSLIGTKTVSYGAGSYILQCYGSSPIPGEDRIEVSGITGTISATVKSSVITSASLLGFCHTGRDCNFAISASGGSYGLATPITADVDILDSNGNLVYNACRNMSGACSWKIPQDIPLTPASTTTDGVPGKIYYASFHVGPAELKKVQFTIYPGLMIVPTKTTQACTIGNSCRLDWTTKGPADNSYDMNRARLFLTDLSGNVLQDLWSIGLCEASRMTAQYCTFIVPASMSPGNYQIRFKDSTTSYIYTTTALNLSR